ncbi:hypothetical protein FM106_11345 [Brachybacterium faecium]|nr:hypothetical protein FM106_11345 [Brachybacterium faecium]
MCSCFFIYPKKSKTAILNFFHNIRNKINKKSSSSLMGLLLFMFFTSLNL